MIWEIRVEPMAAGALPPAVEAGRYVAHRHRDAEGPHIDLRLEEDGCLRGWRIAGTDWPGGGWATEKAPHPLRWLEQDEDAERLDAGRYGWLDGEGADRALVLWGDNGGGAVVRGARPAIPLAALRAAADAAGELGCGVEAIPGLARDGRHARARAVARFCGLGRELDGDAFDEAVWREALDRMPLESIHGQLRAYEARFDAKYPPVPASRPERLPDAEDDAPGVSDALAIMRG